MSKTKVHHSIILQKSLPYLVENIYDVHEIVDHLLASELISWDEKDEISSQITRRRRLETLLNVIRVKHRSAYDVFCEALSESQNGFVRQELERMEMKLADEGKSGTIIAQETAGRQNDWFEELDEHTRCRQLTAADMSRLSRQLSPHSFFHIGQLMGFSKSQLEQYQVNDSYSVSTQIFKMLCDWLAKEDDQATVDRLVSILRNAGISETDYRDVIEQHTKNAHSSCSNNHNADFKTAHHAPQWV